MNSSPIPSIINYGHLAASQPGEIRLLARQSKDSFSIEIEDTAIPFDPSEHANEAIEKISMSPEKRPDGGMGIYLALKGVDHFHDEWNQPYNRVTLSMNR